MPDAAPTVPRALGDGLELRAMRADDAGALSAFVTRVMGNDVDGPDGMAGIWARELLRGDHPTVSPADGTLVFDSASNRIVSCCFLIRQTWTYAGIAFGTGRPELIATDPAYRKRGLVRAQMEVIHARSAALGHHIQVITGIPMFYRQFGYEPALVTAGGRHGSVSAVPELAPGDADQVHMRPATEADLPFITRMYRRAAARSLIAAVRDESIWRHELLVRDPGSDYWHELNIVESATGDPAGFVAFVHQLPGESLPVTVFELDDGVSWHDVTPAVLRALRTAGAKRAATAGSRLAWIAFDGIPHHPVLQMARQFFSSPLGSFTFHVRIADLAGFIRHIAPALEGRLASSAFAGYTGDITIAFYPAGLRLRFAAGRLTAAEDLSNLSLVTAGAAFPGRTVFQLLFGSRSVTELEHAFPAEAWARTDSVRLLLDTLFPKLPSAVWPIA